MLKGLEIYSPTWIVLAEWGRAEIAKLQTQIEVQGLDPIKTEFIRGRIDQLRKVLALSTPEQPPIPSGPDDTSI